MFISAAKLNILTFGSMAQFWSHPLLVVRGTATRQTRQKAAKFHKKATGRIQNVNCMIKGCQWYPPHTNGDHVKLHSNLINKSISR